MYICVYIHTINGLKRCFRVPQDLRIVYGTFGSFVSILLFFFFARRPCPHAGHPLPHEHTFRPFLFSSSEGDYDVTIPVGSAAGMYKIRVGLFGDDSVYACSPAFEITPAGESLWVDTPEV